MNTLGLGSNNESATFKEILILWEFFIVIRTNDTS